MQKSLDDYFAAHRITQPSRADVVLALLRINTPEALKAAEAIVGRPIERCPANIPPWPPKPVQRAPEPRIISVSQKNPHFPSSSLHHRFQQIRVGMTISQLTRRGITRRDMRQWIKLRAIELSNQ